MELKKAADQGCIEAQYNLGNMYDQNGQTAEALKSWLQAAIQGDAYAQDSLGKRLLKQNPKEGFLWLMEAAHQGNSGAQHSLGFLYQIGSYVERDLKEAAKWYQLSLATMPSPDRDEAEVSKIRKIRKS